MKKLGFVLLVIVLLLIVNGLVHSIFDLWQKQSLLTQAQQELNAQKLKNTKLKAELSYVQSPQFINQTARNELFLSKPGEQQVIIENQTPNSSRPAATVDNRPNWQKWLQLFF